MPKWDNIYPYNGDDFTDFKMREMDYLETSATMGITSPLLILKQAVSKSQYTWVIKTNRILGVFGVTPYPQTDVIGIPWLIGDEGLSDISPKTYVRMSKDIIEAFHRKFEVLANIVMADYVKAIRWLEVIGFTVNREDPYIYSDKQFYMFHKRNKEELCVNRQH